jgi:hypothetical protein
MWFIARVTTSTLERLLIVVVRAKLSVRLAMSLVVSVLLVRLRNNKMKRQKKELTAHEKAVILMNRETNRAVNHVKLLEKLYLETLKAKETVK